MKIKIKGHSSDRKHFHTKKFSKPLFLVNQANFFGVIQNKEVCKEMCFSSFQKPFVGNLKKVIISM